MGKGGWWGVCVCGGGVEVITNAHKFTQIPHAEVCLCMRFISVWTDTLSLLMSNWSGENAVSAFPVQTPSEHATKDFLFSPFSPLPIVQTSDRMMESTVVNL